MMLLNKVICEGWKLISYDFFFFKSGVKDDDAIFKKPREVVHKNTRFTGDPFSKALNKSQIQQAAALNAQVNLGGIWYIMKSENTRCSIRESYIVKFALDSETCSWLVMFSEQFKQGKVGPDGKELIPHESPTVNGYGFERSPSPAPGKQVWKSSSALLQWDSKTALVNDSSRRIEFWRLFFFFWSHLRCHWVTSDDVGWDWEYPVSSGWIRHPICWEEPWSIV